MNYDTITPSKCIFCDQEINEPEEPATILIFHGMPIPAHETCYDELAKEPDDD